MSELLFKFGRASGIASILETESIFITSPLDLNDPFEMRPAWTNIDETYARESRNALVRAAKGAPLFMDTGDGVQQVGSFPTLEDEPEVDVDNQYGVADMHLSRIFSFLHKRLRILSWVSGLFDVDEDSSFSDDKATLMWAHYADSFQGACIAVDPGFVNNGLNAGGYAVSYDEERKGFPFHLESIALEYFVQFLTAKSPAWDYEKEVRFIYDLNDLKPENGRLMPGFVCDACEKRGVPLAQCKTPHYRDAIRLPPEAVKAVIFGVDTHPSDVEKILNLMGQERYKEVKTFWSSYHSERYRIQYCQGTPVDIKKYQEMRNRDFNVAKGHKIFDGQAYKYFSERKGSCIDISNVDSHRKDSDS